MSHRLSTAINMGQYASSILRQVKHFEGDPLLEGIDFEERNHIGIEPMLLALSMEFALKAWYVFDHDKPEVIRSHNLLKLYEGLLPESQNRLDEEFRISVAPRHPNLFETDYSIKDVLDYHSDTFVEWRYFHEMNRTLSFNQTTFVATLEMVLSEFRKRYRIEKIPPNRTFL
jgi:hypothetical protein